MTTSEKPETEFSRFNLYNEMGQTSSMHGHIKIRLENLRETDRFGDLTADGRIILKCFKKFWEKLIA
jgi:hypothetical protein